jgi:hypothetical protein
LSRIKVSSPGTISPKEALSGPPFSLFAGKIQNLKIICSISAPTVQNMGLLCFNHAHHRSQSRRPQGNHRRMERLNFSFSYPQPHLASYFRVSSSGRSGKNEIGGSSIHLILIGRQFGNTYMTTSEKPSSCSLGKMRTCLVLPKKSVSWTNGSSTSTHTFQGNPKDHRPKASLHTGHLQLQGLSS